MTGLRGFVGEFADRLAEIEDTLIEGNLSSCAAIHASELVRDLSEYVDRILTGLDDDGVEPE